MKLCRIDLGLVGMVGVSCLALVWTPTAWAQVKLEYKFPEGRKLTYKTTSKINQNLSFMGMGMETEESRTQVLSLAVGKRRGDSTLPIEERVESLHVQMSLPGEISLTYDSANDLFRISKRNDPKSKVDAPTLGFLGQVFKLSAQMSYTVILDEHNKVKAIEGAEKLLAQAEKLDAFAKETIHGRIEPEKLKADFEQEHQNLPDVLARPGEPWERTESVEISNGQTLSFRRKYEYVGTERKGDKALDKIACKVIGVAFKQDPDSKSPLKVAKSDLKVQSSEGTILFDRDRGCVVSARDRTRLKGSMTFSGNGQEIPGDTELSLESNTQLQPEAK